MEENKVIFNGERVNNIYVIDLSSLTNQGIECFVAIKDDTWMWHMRFGHTSMTKYLMPHPSVILNGN